MNFSTLLNLCRCSHGRFESFCPTNDDPGASGRDCRKLRFCRAVLDLGRSCFRSRFVPRGASWQPREVEQKAEPKRKVVKKAGRPWHTPMFQKEKQRLKKKCWRFLRPISQYLPKSISPRKLVNILFYWSQKIFMQTVSLWLGIGIDRGPLREAYQVIRSYICCWLILQNQPLKGGPGLAVVIDETFITPLKKSRSLRRPRAHHQAAADVHLWRCGNRYEHRKQTGRCYLRYIDNRKAETLKQLVQGPIAAGTPIWTDDFPSYDWHLRDTCMRV